jgi:hypothetical protein
MTRSESSVSTVRFKQAPEAMSPERRRKSDIVLGLVLLGLLLFCGQASAQVPEDGGVEETSEPSLAQDLPSPVPTGKGPTEVPPEALGSDSSAPASEPETTWAPLPPPESGVPRWLEDVRAQRRALQEGRRAMHQARRRAIDPVGAARQEALEQEFYRRRREMREMMANDRKLFRQSPPWQGPWLSAPNQASGHPDAGRRAGSQTEGGIGQGTENTTGKPAEWNNGWYFRGW